MVSWKDKYLGRPHIFKLTHILMKELKSQETIRWPLLVQQQEQGR